MKSAWAAFERLTSEDTLGSVFDDRREAERHRFLCGCAALSEFLLGHWRCEIAPEWPDFLTLVHALRSAPEKQLELAAFVGDSERLQGVFSVAIDELARVHAPASFEPGIFKGALGMLISRESRMHDPELRAWFRALFEVDSARAALTGPGARLDEVAVRRGLHALAQVRGMGPLFVASFDPVARAA